MKYLLIISVLLMSCNTVKLRSNVTDFNSLEFSKKDLPIMEMSDAYMLRMDSAVAITTHPDSNRKSYFEKTQTLAPIVFTNKSTKLSNQALKAITRIARHLKTNPKLFVLLRGYTYKESEISSFNKNLSEARNLAVKNTLATHGITPQRVFTQPLGEYDSSGNFGKKANTYRRVETIFGLIKEK